jgi:hypothetical protein
VVDGGAGVVGREGVGEHVLTCRPCVREARPADCIWSMGPGGRVPTYALKLYIPQMQIVEMSLRETPSRTVVEPRVSANCCCPTAMGTWKAVAPAGALKL